MIQDLETYLQSCNSRAKCDILKQSYLSKHRDLNELYDLAKHRDAEFNNRVSWVFNHTIESEPEWIVPYLNDIIDWLPHKNDSTQRNMLRAVTCYGVPHKQEGLWIDFCFDILLNPDKAVAVKVHAMEIAFRLTKKYPDLKDELRAVLEQFYEESTVAFQARARKVFKQLDKL